MPRETATGSLIHEQQARVAEQLADRQRRWLRGRPGDVIPLTSAQYARWTSNVFTPNYSAIFGSVAPTAAQARAAARQRDSENYLQALRDFFERNYIEKKAKWQPPVNYGEPDDA